jgi:hypothetical protein
MNAFPLLFRKRALLWLLLLAGFALPLQAAKVAPAGATAQLGALVDQSGFRFRKFGDAVWVVYLNGTEDREWRVICAANPDFIVISIVVAEKRTMRLTEDALRQLLRLEHGNDFVKIGLDAQDDLFVRSEVKIQDFNLADFKAIVRQNIKTAEAVQAAIKPYRLP